MLTHWANSDLAPQKTRMAMTVKVCMQDNRVECVQPGRLPDEIFAVISLRERGEFLCCCFRHRIYSCIVNSIPSIMFSFESVFQFLMNIVNLDWNMKTLDGYPERITEGDRLHGQWDAE